MFNLFVWICTTWIFYCINEYNFIWSLSLLTSLPASSRYLRCAMASPVANHLWATGKWSQDAAFMSQVMRDATWNAFNGFFPRIDNTSFNRWAWCLFNSSIRAFWFFSNRRWPGRIRSTWNPAILVGCRLAWKSLPADRPSRSWVCRCSTAGTGFYSRTSACHPSDWTVAH